MVMNKIMVISIIAKHAEEQKAFRQPKSLRIYIEIEKTS